MSTIPLYETSTTQMLFLKILFLKIQHNSMSTLEFVHIIFYFIAEANFLESLSQYPPF